MRDRSFRPTLLVPFFLVVVGSCGPDTTAPKLDTVPVKGKITYNGRPLTKGIVRFKPVDTGRVASGQLKADGTFVLSTFKEGDGATVGLHRVSVSGTGPKPARELVPKKYLQPLTSKLEADVSPENTEFTFDLK